MHLGLHDAEEAAAEVFDLKKLELKGLGAKKLNFPERSRQKFLQQHPELSRPGGETQVVTSTPSVEVGSYGFQIY